MDPLNCGWDTARFLIFSGNVFAPLIYYSHLGPLIASTLIGIAVIFNNPRALINRALFVITTTFAVWVYADLVLWASEKAEYVMFFWAILVPIELLIYVASWYLIYVFANRGEEPPLRQKAIAALTFVPVFLFAHTSYNLLGYDLTNCDRAAVEGPLIQYLYLIEIFFVIWIITMTVRAYRHLSDVGDRRQLLIISTGVVLFLLAFSIGNV